MILNYISMWGGVAGCVLAIVAIIIMAVTKANINHVLSTSEILFNDAFAVKKQVIEEAMLLVDEVELNDQVLRHPEFINRAKKCYNNLLCVVSEMLVAEQFYNLVIEGKGITPVSIAQLKLNCRKDIGLSIKHAKIVKRAAQIKPTNYSYKTQQIQPTQPAQKPGQPAQPPQRIIASGVRPAGRPVQGVNMQQPIQNPVRPVQSQPMRKTDHQ